MVVRVVSEGTIKCKIRNKKFNGRTMKNRQKHGEPQSNKQKLKKTTTQKKSERPERQMVT